VNRDVRYQAAVVTGDCLLLLRCREQDGREFWVLPGGGREDETEVECVAREVLEESGLEVSVGPVLYEVAAVPPDGTYARWRTYLCRVIGGTAAPGGGEGWADLLTVRWLSLTNIAAWEPELLADEFLGPQLVRIRSAIVEQK
jgi:8-oxo-dGTP pyrophosphatase MutT (NUDIX family)